MNLLFRYVLYTLLYVPVEVIFILLLIYFTLYNIVVFAINTFYYFAQSEKRKNGIPYSQVVNYQDNFFLWIETPSNLSYNTLVLKLKGRIDLGEFKTNLSEKVLSGLDENNEAIFPKLRQVISKGYLFSTWEGCTEFNLDELVTEHTLDFNEEGSIERFVCEMDKHEIIKSKVQWKIYLIKDPNVEETSYMAWRVHHSLGDAMSMWKVIFKLCNINNKEDIGWDKLALARLTPTQRVLANVKTFLCIPMYLTDMLIFIATHYRKYTEGVTSEKQSAWSNRIDFQKIRQIKTKTKTTVNDVVMTLVTESSRRYFNRRSHSDLIERDIVYGMAVSLDTNFDNLQLSNNDAGILIVTPTSVEGMLNQLKVINRNMSRMKHEFWGFFYSMMLYFLITLPIPVYMVRKLTGMMAIGIGNFSNVFGPTFPLKMNSVLVDEAYCLVMTSWSQALGIVFLTYNGKMCVAIRGDSCLVDQPREMLDEIAKVLDEMYAQVSTIS